ncbi:MAG: hypothetical protein R3Y64_01230 [Peptostreptococcaceae bacterium]
MNQLLLIIGMIALNNGDIGLENKDGKSRKIKVKKNKLSFNSNDFNKGIKMLELSDEDLERGVEVINRSKKYMSKEEQVFLVKVESILDLVRGIKRFNGDARIDDSEFFLRMDDEDKKNMMIKEILEVFPDRKKDSFGKAIDIKKKIDLFAELFLPDDFGEDGFSLSSLMNLNNLSSLGNLSILGDLLRDTYPEIDDEYVEEYEETYVEEDIKEEYTKPKKNKKGLKRVKTKIKKEVDKISEDDFKNYIKQDNAFSNQNE